MSKYRLTYKDGTEPTEFDCISKHPDVEAIDIMSDILGLPFPVPMAKFLDHPRADTFARIEPTFAQFFPIVENNPRTGAVPT